MRLLLVANLFCLLLLSCNRSEYPIRFNCENDSNGIFISETYPYFATGGIKSDKHSFSGKYSVELTPDNPFGLTTILKKLVVGDHLRISVWRHASNKNGVLIISAENSDDLYITQQTSGKTKNNWDQLILDVIIPPTVTSKEVKVYVWLANDSLPVYFDDLTIDKIEGPKKIITTGTLTDPRDRKVYKTVRIGNDEWMQENLNYNIPGSRCYNDDENLCTLYGRLYSFDQALIALPEGWYLPTDEDFMRLEKTLGLPEEELKKYGDRGTNEAWMLRESGSSGFEVKQSGAWAGGYYNLKRSGYLWTSSEIDSVHAYCREVSHRADIGRFRDSKTMYFSVRGIRKVNTTD